MVFDRLFGRKKDKKEEKFSSDLTLADLKPGYFIDYDLKSWQVLEEYEYDWGNNFFSKEYKLDSGDEKVFLHLEEDDELELSISKPLKLSKVTPKVKSHIIDTDEPPKKIYLNDEQYILSSEDLGHFRKTGEEDWSNFVSWEFENEEETAFISIERWGETDIEASYGKYVESYEFSNLVPNA